MENSDNLLCLRQLVVELKDIADAHTLGVHLGLPHSRLTAIRENHPHNVDQQKSEILNSWLEADPDKSWDKLVTVLGKMDKGAIAKEIALKYCTSSHSLSSSERLLATMDQDISQANEVIIKIKLISDHLCMVESSRQLERISSMLTSGKMQMGVVGLTNCGKSTTLNALMGRDFLPSSFQRQTVSSVCIQHTPNSPGELLGRNSSSEGLILLASGVQQIRSSLANLNKHDRDNKVVYTDIVLRAHVAFLDKRIYNVEIFDTPGTSEAGSSNVATIWSTALNNLAAIVLIVSAEDISNVSQAALLKEIQKLHPQMMEKKNRLLVLVNKYDKCFDSNPESWNPTELKEQVAKFLKMPTEQIVLFSATAALKARKWKQNSITVDEDMYGKEYFDLRHTPEKDSIAHLREYKPENVTELGEALEKFSRIQEIESKLLEKLCVNGPAILVESAVDDSLREVGKLKSSITEKIKALDVEGKKLKVTEQESIILRINEFLNEHCKKKIDHVLPNLVLQAFEVQLNAIASILENHIVTTSSGKLVSLQGQFDDRNHILQRVLTVRTDMQQFSEDKIKEAWSTGISEMKVRLTTQLTHLLQEIKQDIVTAHLTENICFDSIDTNKLVEDVSFPSAQQLPPFNDLNNTAINPLILPRTITRQKVERHFRKGGRRYGIAGPKEKIYYDKVVNYPVTVYEASIDSLSGVFQRLASFSATHIRESLVAILSDVASRLSQVLWESLQQLSRQPLQKLKTELDERIRTLNLGQQEVKDLEAKNHELCQAESELNSYLL